MSGTGTVRLATPSHGTSTGVCTAPKAPHRSEIGRVTRTHPEIRIFLQGSNLELGEQVLFFTDSCPPSKLRVNDNVGVTKVDNWAVVHDVVRLAGVGRPSGSTTVTKVKTTKKVGSAREVLEFMRLAERGGIPGGMGVGGVLSNQEIDELFVRPPEDGTIIGDPEREVALIRLNGAWLPLGGPG